MHQGYASGLCSRRASAGGMGLCIRVMQKGYLGGMGLCIRVMQQEEWGYASGLCSRR